MGEDCGGSSGELFGDKLCKVIERGTIVNYVVENGKLVKQVYRGNKFITQL